MIYQYAGKTSLKSELFAEILEGSCALDRRLRADSAETIDWQADEAYAGHVRAIDEHMKKVLALSVGHEFFEPMAAMDADKAREKLYEGGVFSFAIEASMKALGGAAESDDVIGKAIRGAMAAEKAGDASWQAGFDSAFIRDRVAAALGVTVKG